MKKKWRRREFSILGGDTTTTSNCGKLQVRFAMRANITTPLMYQTESTGCTKTITIDMEEN